MLLFLLFNISLASAQTRVAVLDSGLDLSDTRFKNILCHEYHYDFTKEGLFDRIGHGTHIVGLIQQYAKNSNYCLIIIKYARNTGSNKPAYLLALKRAIELKVDIVNLSGGGVGLLKEEMNLIKNNPKIKFIVCAGNEHEDITENKYYPASYGFKNIITVGSIDNIGRISMTSNYGSLVDVWEVGENVISTLPGYRMGMMSGTSMSTAIHTGKYIRNLNE